MRHAPLTVLCSLAGVVFLAGDGLAGWSADPTLLKATSSELPVVSACSDEVFGAIVVWQEKTSGSLGILRAQHMFPTGDVDPDWAVDGEIVCAEEAYRSAIGIVPDRQHGAYIWWMEGADLYLTRIRSNGAVADGWPERGRLLGNLPTVDHRPHAISDGVWGVYVAWNQSAAADVRVIRIGPDNTGTGGWPETSRPAAPLEPASTDERWPRIALAPNSGVYVAWAHTSEVRLTKMTGSGALPDPTSGESWPVAGKAFSFEGAPQSSPWSRIDIATDDNLGVTLFTVAPFAYPSTDARVRRLQSDGTTRPGWPEEGVPNPWALVQGEFGAEVGVRVFPNGPDEVLTMLPYLSVHWPLQDIGIFRSSGTAFSCHAGNNIEGSEAISDGAGGLFVATFKPTNAYGPYQPDASLAVKHFRAPAGWSDFYEGQSGPPYSYYGDIALAPTGDGGVYFFWSQHRERFGLLARRFNGSGEVVSVPPPSGATLPLRAVFRPGAGVVVQAALEGPASGRIDLFDLHGRRRGDAAFAGARGSVEILIDGTEVLESGVYFVRAEFGTETRSARVVVTR